MAETYGEVFRKVLLHAPVATPFLARDWISSTYRQAADRRHWSWLTGEGEILTEAAASRTATTVVRGSAVVLSADFVAGDAGRQWRISGPPYTILSVVPGVSATLDRVYGGTSASAQLSQVIDAYATLPMDFGSFIAVLDPQNGWQLNPWATADQLNARDPGRFTVGTPLCLASRRYSTYTPTAGQIQYELWPYPASAFRYPYYYTKRPSIPTDAEYFLGPLRERTDIILDGALAKAAQWPGLPGRPNPYFVQRIQKEKLESYAVGLQDLETRDEEVYLTWLETVDWINRSPFAPYDANFMRNHDFGGVSRW